MSNHSLGPSEESVEHAMERIFGRDPWWVRLVQYLGDTWRRTRRRLWTRR